MSVGLMPQPTDLPLKAIAESTSLTSLGETLVSWLARFLRFERFNIGLIEPSQQVFVDAFVFGTNVRGRRVGHRRPLAGTVVEAGIRAGRGIWVSGSRATLLARFPGFGPVYDSGIRSMLAVPLRRNGEVTAALVLASTESDAFDDQALALAGRLGVAANERIHELSGTAIRS